MLSGLHLEYEPLTLLNIAGISHLERVYHNFYKFYLEIYDNRVIHKIFMKALLILIRQKGKEIEELNDWNLKSEVVTNAGNRLDLLIESLDHLEQVNILIEIKINAILNNDLDEYWATFGSEKSIGIVLSLNSMKLDNTNYINITHVEWCSLIKQLYLEYTFNLLKEEELIFLEFIRSVELMNKYSDVKKLDLQFYQENRKSIEKLYDYHTQVIRMIDDGVIALGNSLHPKKKPYLLKDKTLKNIGFEALYILEVNSKQHIGLDFTTEYMEGLSLFSVGFDLLGNATQYLNKLQKSIVLNKLFNEDSRLKKVSLVVVDKYACVFYKDYKVEDLLDVNDIDASMIHLYKTEWKPILDLIKDELLKIK